MRNVKLAADLIELAKRANDATRGLIETTGDDVVSVKPLPIDGDTLCLVNATFEDVGQFIDAIRHVTDGNGQYVASKTQVDAVLLTTMVAVAAFS